MNFNDYVQLAVAVGTIGATTVGIISLVRQTRQDRQIHEFRDVQWEGAWIETGKDRSEFRLKNVGSTTAKNVRVEVDTWDAPTNPLKTSSANTFKPGDEKTLFHGTHREVKNAAVIAENYFGTGVIPAFTVWWRSPLGHPSTIDVFV